MPVGPDHHVALHLPTTHHRHRGAGLGQQLLPRRRVAPDHDVVAPDRQRHVAVHQQRQSHRTSSARSAPARHRAPPGPAPPTPRRTPWRHRGTEPRRRYGSEALGRLVGAPHLAQGVADLTDGGVRGQRLLQRRQHVVGAARPPPGPAASAPLDRGRVAVGPQRRPAARPAPPRWPDRPAAARTAPPRPARTGSPPPPPARRRRSARATVVRRPLDLALLEALLDRGHRATPLGDRRHQPLRSRPPGRRSATRPRTSRRTGRRSWSGRSRTPAPAGCAAPAGPPSGVGSAIASSKELVCSDWVPPSTAASACRVTRTRLTSGCWAVSCTPAVWVWKRSISDFGSRRAEPVPHQPGPDPPGGPELGHLLQQRGPGRRRRTTAAGANVVDRQPGRQRRLDVGDPVGQGEGDLLRRRRPGLGHVVAGDRDGVPARQVLPAVGERVADQAQRRLPAGRCRCRGRCTP